MVPAETSATTAGRRRARRRTDRVRRSAQLVATGPERRPVERAARGSWMTPPSAEKRFLGLRDEGPGALDDVTDQGVDVHGLGLSLEVQDDAVAQRGRREGLEVVHAHVVATFGERPHLGAQNESL